MQTVAPLAVCIAQDLTPYSADCYVILQTLQDNFRKSARSGWRKCNAMRDLGLAEAGESAMLYSMHAAFLKQSFAV